MGNVTVEARAIEATRKTFEAIKGDTEKEPTVFNTFKRGYNQGTIDTIDNVLRTLDEMVEYYKAIE